MTYFAEVKLLPQQFPDGLRVLVVDHDTSNLNSITEMCVGCNYQVTTCCNAAFALDLLKETKNLYDVILIDAQMPDMDSYNFLQYVTREINIPVMMMCVEQSTSPSLVMKALEKGACGYWIKPLSEGQIKNIWQHIARKVLNENNQHDQVVEILNAKGLKKRERDASCVAGKKNDDNVNTKKYRLSWSQELHQHFLRVVTQLGIHDAKPKTIIKLMDVPGLTTQQVASHLQKLRKKSTEENEKSKVEKKNSKLLEFDVQDLTTDTAPNETSSSFEVFNSMANSSVQGDNTSGAHLLNTVEDCEVLFKELDNIISQYEAWSPSEFDVFN